VGSPEVLTKRRRPADGFPDRAGPPPAPRRTSQGAGEAVAAKGSGNGRTVADDPVASCAAGAAVEAVPENGAAAAVPWVDAGLAVPTPAGDLPVVEGPVAVAARGFALSDVRRNVSPALVELERHGPRGATAAPRSMVALAGTISVTPPGADERPAIDRSTTGPR